MEVYLNEIPLHCPKKVLHQTLAMHIDELGITEWQCEKFTQSRHGRIIFANENEGRRFLNKFHSDIVKTSKLRILDTGILVAKGRNQPNHLDVLHVKLNSKERTKYNTAVREKESQGHTVSYGPIKMPLDVISCGKCHVRDDDVGMVFCPEGSARGGGEVKFGRSSLFITLADESQAEIIYDSIWEATAGNEYDMVFVLQHPPRFFMPLRPAEGDNLSSIMASLSLQIKKWGPSYKKVRVSWLPSIKNHDKMSGFCLAYKLQFSGKAATIASALQQIKHRQLFNLITKYPFKTIAPFGDLAFIRNYRILLNMIQNSEIERDLTFGVCFQLQLLAMGNFLPPDVIIKLAEKIRIYSRTTGKRPAFSIEAFRKLISIIPYPTVGTEASALHPDTIFKQLQRADVEMETYARSGRTYQKTIQEKQVYVLKASVTPTRIFLMGPEPESKNRVLRKFSESTDYFLRVQFCDEDSDDVRFGGRISNEELMTRFKGVFRDGIQVAGRLYKFLGFSHSSLRSHSAWFVAAFWDKKQGKFQTFDSILQSLGNFRAIRTPARCAARIGQAFSETPISITLKLHGINYAYIPDIKSPDGERVFSDGVGTISYDAAAVIWEQSLKNESFPTCFQVRWGGAKGMLSLDARLPGKVFCIREESMVKFQSNDLADLEICDMAIRPLRLVLNRQMIKILEDMGVRHEWFMNLQRAEIETLRTVTSDPYNVSSFLRDQSIGRRIGLPQLIRQLHRLGINYRQDLFLRRAVEMSVLRELRLLKNKARIPVRRGATLFGVVDETGYLGEGQIYVAIDSPYLIMFEEPPPVYGRVLVTRSPALHPGDIQGAVQNTPPEGHPLRELSNCVVFSRWGDRDLPSQLSGGDLDGDIYNIIWDPEVVQTNQLKMFTPADYPRVKPKTLDRDVRSEDMAEFFVDFMKTDQLGVIANRHQILADQHDDGTLAPECLKLAEMHSSAVDFSKTGLAVDVNEMPKAKRYRPDFMAPCPPTRLYDLQSIDIEEQQLINPDADPWDEDSDDIAPAHRYYESQRILGKLYRNVDEKKIWDEAKHSHIRSDDDMVWAQLHKMIEALIKQYVGGSGIDWYTKQSDAEDLKIVYEDGISNMMRSFAPNYMNPLSETEVFCGFIFNRAGHQSRRQRDLSVKIGTDVDNLFDFIVRRMRNLDHSPPPPQNDPDDDHATANGDTSAIVTDPEDLRTELQNAKDTLALCLACFRTRPTQGGYGVGPNVPGELKGFRVLAAGCLLKQIGVVRKLQERIWTEEELGGFVRPNIKSEWF